MSQALVLHAAAAIFIIGFVIRDLILSRAVFAFASALFIFGFANMSGGFFALLWAVLFLVVNLTVLSRALRDRFTDPLSADEKALLAEMPGFSEADFRRLMAICEWQTLDEDKQLTEQGVPASHLYYIVSGSATVNKSGHEIEVGDNLLIGEISFSQDVPATATVHGHKGSEMVVWPAKKLHRALKRKSLKASFDELLSHDLAEKLAADEIRATENG